MKFKDFTKAVKMLAKAYPDIATVSDVRLTCSRTGRARVVFDVTRKSGGTWGFQVTERKKK